MQWHTISDIPSHFHYFFYSVSFHSLPFLSRWQWMMGIQGEAPRQAGRTHDDHGEVSCCGDKSLVWAMWRPMAGCLRIKHGGFGERVDPAQTGLCLASPCTCGTRAVVATVAQGRRLATRTVKLNTAFSLDTAKTLNKAFNTATATATLQLCGGPAG